MVATVTNWGIEFIESPGRVKPVASPDSQRILFMLLSKVRGIGDEAAPRKPNGSSGRSSLDREKTLPKRQDGTEKGQVLNSLGSPIVEGVVIVCFNNPQPQCFPVFNLAYFFWGGSIYTSEEGADKVASFEDKRLFGS